VSVAPFGLALTSSALWGSADYWAGTLSRRIDSMRVVLWSQAASLAMLVAIIVIGRVEASWQLAGYGAIAGAAGAIGLSCFYRGLAVGTMSLVTPASSLGVLVPVVVSLVRGQVPGALAGVGIVVALAGIAAMASNDATVSAADARASRASILYGLAAAGAFGTFMVGLDASLDAAGGNGVASVLWLGMGARAGSVALLVPLAWGISRTLAPPPRRLALPVCAVGMLDAGANMLYAAATVGGLLAVVAVLGNLYPFVTVGLARLLLHERLTRRQDIGVALAVCGVLLVAAA
jgi:drug/metabolite transporter (DMT)-like permease